MKKLIIYLLLALTSNIVTASEQDVCKELIDKIENIAELKKALHCQNKQRVESDTAPTQQTSPEVTDPALPPVKKSKNNICHKSGTRYYAQTRKFTPFDNIQACLDSGGRLPKR